MARNETPPFGRGQTGTQALNATDLAQWEGKEWVFEDLDYSQPAPYPARSGQYVTCRCVRNVSSIALLPKRLVAFKAANYGFQVDGYTTTTAADWAGVVDEFLPTAGVAANDLFWIVVTGPTQLLPDLAAGANNVITNGDVLIALTAATSQATTAGRAYSWNSAMTFTSTQTTDGTAGNVLLNRIGRALSSRTTAQTTTGFLAYVDRV